MKKLTEKYLFLLLPYLITITITIISWLFNLQLWRWDIDEKIKNNYCLILNQTILDKKEDLQFKQSNTTANIYSKLSGDDALQYYKQVERESLRLNNDIELLQKQRDKNGC